MHVFLVLETAFMIWMLVDAINRRAEYYWYIIIFVPFGEWVYFFTVKIHDFNFGPFRRDCKCATCKHCEALYDDGATCRAGGGTPIFRTNVHIDYCTHYERA